MQRATSITEALDGKFPEWIVYVLTHDPDGADDIMPAGWCMSCSAEPPMLAVALGVGRHTGELIERTGEFVVAWAGAGQYERVTFTGTRSGRTVDKFAALALPTAPGVATSVPLLADAPRNLECQLRAIHPSGDHRIFVGEIVAAHVADPPITNLVNFGGRYAAAVPAG